VDFGVWPLGVVSVDGPVKEAWDSWTRLTEDPPISTLLSSWCRSKASIVTTDTVADALPTRYVAKEFLLGKL